MPLSHVLDDESAVNGCSCGFEVTSMMCLLEAFASPQEAVAGGNQGSACSPSRSQERPVAVDESRWDLHPVELHG